MIIDDDDDGFDVVVDDDDIREIVGAFMEIFNATHVYIKCYGLWEEKMGTKTAQRIQNMTRII